MKTIILSKNPYIYSTNAIVNEYLKKDLNISVVNPLECNVYKENNINYITNKGQLLDKVDFVIPRIGSASHFYGIYLVQAFEENNIQTLNSFKGILNSRNKYNTYLKLVENNIPTPKTALIKSTENIDFILDKLGKFPVIIKLTRGSQGKGVMYADSYNSLRSIIDTMSLLEEDIIIQQYFHTEPKNSDIRLYVLYNTVIGSTQRINNYDFRSNTHCGGSMKQININNELAEIALKTANCFNLNFCSIDFLQTSEGPKILEINSTPGLEKVETEANLPLTKLLVEKIINNKCLTNTMI
ncbi:MAG: RimK family alpha-L-glutamate ligase [Vampirovibrionia bacterium]